MIATSLNRQVSAWRRWRGLDQVERRLLLETLVILPAMTGAVSALRIATILAWLGLEPLPGEGGESIGSRSADSGIDCPIDHGLLARQVGQAISRVGCRTPWTSTCLARAMAAAWLLGRRGVPVRITLGVANPASRTADNPGPKAGAIDAHAWLEAAGVRVTGESPGRVFQPLARFASPDPRA